MKKKLLKKIFKFFVCITNWDGLNLLPSFNFSQLLLKIFNKKSNKNLFKKNCTHKNTPPRKYTAKPTIKPLFIRFSSYITFNLLYDMYDEKIVNAVHIFFVHLMQAKRCFFFIDSYQKKHNKNNKNNLKKIWLNMYFLFFLRNSNNKYTHI